MIGFNVIIHIGFFNKHPLNQQRGWSKILQAFQACSFLVATISGPLGHDFGCFRLASFMLAIVCNPPSRVFMLIIIFLFLFLHYNY